MTLSVKYKSVHVTDEDQVNPVNVTIEVEVSTDQSDAAIVNGAPALRRFAVKAASTRANVAAFLSTCTVTNKAELPAAVQALLSPPLTVP